MLEIREEQLTAFEQAALKNFEDQMVEHLKEFTPQHCEVIGEAGVRHVIRLGMARSKKKYGLTNQGPVRFYIELMFMFGSDFDTDPLLPWVAEILNDTTTPDQMVRAERLYGTLMDYVEKVAGPDNEYVKAALRRASLQRFEDLRVPAENFENEMVARLKANYPQKCEYVGESALRELIPLGRALARKYAISKDEGVVLLIGLLFAQGHGFATDPQLPWIQATLNNPAITDPNKRIERLYSKVMTYLRHVLASLDQG
jgi:hypothetical protein